MKPRKKTTLVVLLLNAFLFPAGAASLEEWRGAGGRGVREVLRVGEKTSSVRVDRSEFDRLLEEATRLVETSNDLKVKAAAAKAVVALKATPWGIEGKPDTAAKDSLEKFREKVALAGLKRFEVLCYPEDREAIKAFARELQKKREEQAG